MSIRTRAALRTHRRLATGETKSTLVDPEQLEALRTALSQAAESMTAFARAFSAMHAEWSQTVWTYLWQETPITDEAAGMTIDQLIDNIDQVLEEMER